VVVDVQGRDHRRRVAAVDRRDPAQDEPPSSEVTTAPMPTGVPADATQPFQAVSRPDPPPPQAS